MRIARKLPVVVATDTAPQEIRGRVAVAATAVAAAMVCGSLLLISAAAVHLHAAAAARLVLRSRPSKTRASRSAAATVVVTDTFLALAVIGGVAIAARTRVFKHLQLQPWTTAGAVAGVVVLAVIALRKPMAVSRTLRGHVAVEAAALLLGALLLIVVPQRRSDYIAARLLSLITLRAMVVGLARTFG